MKQCLSALEYYDSDTVQLVWQLYEQHMATNSSLCLCNYCKVRNRVSLIDISKYLWRQRSISDKLFVKILASSCDNEVQKALWNALEIELKCYDTPVHLMEALSNALERYSDKYVDLRTEINHWLQRPESLFECSCKKLQAIMLRPIQNSDSDTDTVTSDTDEKVHHQKISRHRTRSNSSNRRNKAYYQEKNKRSVSCKSHARQSSNALSEPPLKQTEIMSSSFPFTSTRKKTTKIFNFHNTKGSVSVENRIIRVGTKQIRDTSNDTDGTTTSISDSEFKRSDSPHTVKDRAYDQIDTGNSLKHPNDHELELELQEFTPAIRNEEHPEC